MSPPVKIHLVSETKATYIHVTMCNCTMFVALTAIEMNDKNNDKNCLQ